MGGQAGCDADPGSREPTDRRPAAEAGIGDAGPDSHDPPDAVPAELQGTWSLDVYCTAIGALERRGFGTIAERPAAAEGLHAGPTTMTLTLYPEYFEISWLRPDGTWQVGWSGPATMKRDSLYLDDRYSEIIRDSFSWSLHGHRLALHYPATGVARVSGLPDDAAPVAYFSLPWTAVDCPPGRPRPGR